MLPYRPVSQRFSSVLKLSTIVTAALLLAPAIAVAAPLDSGSAGSGSADTGSGSSNHSPNNYATECPDVLVVAVSGATDSKVDRDPLDDGTRLPWSNWIGNVTVPTGDANKHTPGAVGWVYVPYPSTYGVGVLENVPTYQESVSAGVKSMNNILDTNKLKCGTKTKYALVGYSVGSEVAERVTRDIGNRPDTALVGPNDIAGAAFFGDPYRPAGTPSAGKPGPDGGGFMSNTPGGYGKLSDKIMSACRPYDVACDAPKKIAVLTLALQVLGQMHFTLLNPVQTVSDFAKAVSSISARTIAYVLTDPNWFESNQTVLDVVMKAADETDAPGNNRIPAKDLSNDQIMDALNWAMGPGSDVVKKKLEAEGAGFLDANSDIFELVTKPYIFLGFAEHLLYWSDIPFDPWRGETAKVVEWITSLAQENHKANQAKEQRGELKPGPGASGSAPGSSESGSAPSGSSGSTGR